MTTDLICLVDYETGELVVVTRVPCRAMDP